MNNNVVCGGTVKCQSSSWTWRLAHKQRNDIISPHLMHAVRKYYYIRSNISNICICHVWKEKKKNETIRLQYVGIQIACFVVDRLWWWWSIHTYFDMLMHTVSLFIECLAFWSRPKFCKGQKKKKTEEKRYYNICHRFCPLKQNKTTCGLPLLLKGIYLISLFIIGAHYSLLP